MRNRTGFRGVALLGGALLLAGCGDFLEVTNPGPIQDEALNDPDAVPGLVTGMSGDLAFALSSLTYATSMMADELAHGGSYTAEGLWYRGIVNDEDINGSWGNMQRARWVAENGLERMKAIEDYNYEGDENAIRANLFAGFSNRLLGENVCSTAIDGGPEEPHTVHFGRAEAYFTEAYRLAQAQGKASLGNAALAGRASVRAWQGNWAGADADAEQVPISFQYDAIFSLNSDREQNGLVSESNRDVGRKELTVYNTPWVARDSLDPRVPWQIMYRSGKVETGQDGKTPFYQQLKYTALDADMAYAKGTEMLMLRAEAALRNDDDVAMMTAMEYINAERDFYGLPALPEPAGIAEAWAILDVERAAVVWLEARRFWDLRRWYEEGRIGEWKDAGHDKCIPISFNERNSNPNLQG